MKECHSLLKHTLLSFYKGMGLEKGKLMILDASRSPFPYRELNISNPPSTPSFMKDPHGISTWKDPNTGNK